MIRSKGVGIYFITQNPQDLPESVLAQLGNRIQHALRAYTPKEMKAIKVAAQSFRPNPDFDTETVITELGTGEALVSFLNEKGQPSVVERAYILSPQSSFDLLNESEQLALITTSPFHQKYATAIDRESAYEKLVAKASKEVQEEKKEAEKERSATEKTEQKRHGTEKSVSFLRLAAAEMKIRQEIWRIHPTKCRKEGQKLARMTKSC